jgi:transcriptional regulator with XRE-family HTH domain
VGRRPKTVVESADGSRGVASIGPRLRTLRLAKSIGTRELARRAGVTAGLLSQIEHGAANPSVETLFRLAQCLGTSTDSFFADDSTVPTAAAMVRRESRERIELAGGVIWERLTPTDEHDFEFIEVTYPPGAVSGAAPQVHVGRDYVLMVEGALDVMVGSTVYTLRTGDSFAWDASLPHLLRNSGFVAARLIVVVLDRRSRFAARRIQAASRPFDTTRQVAGHPIGSQ